MGREIASKKAFQLNLENRTNMDLSRLRKPWSQSQTMHEERQFHLPGLGDAQAKLNFYRQYKIV